MIQRYIYGPVSYLAPDRELQSRLELRGVQPPENSCTVHVFLDEVAGDDIDALKAEANYAGAFRLPEDLTDNKGGQPVIRMEITEALRKAKAIRPNFYITFLAVCDTPANAEKPFSFQDLHIDHTVPLNRPLNISANVMIGLGEDK